MIKNVIFDYGNTLAKYIPIDIVNAFDITGKDADFLAKILFDRFYWDKLDAGVMTQQEFCDAVLEKVPERLKKVSFDICENWFRVLPGFDGMEELIIRLKADGFGIYLLSNMGEVFIKAKDSIPLLKYFDGCVFSSEEKMFKPDRKFFKLILDRYQLEPSDCLFVDDLPANIDAAVRCGIHGHLFDGDASKVEAAIYEN